jgi:colanic acid biosynthesis protein WcaH
MFIPEKEYRQILNKTVNLCVDVCLRYNDRLILIKRTEAPCKGVYWPIGGRIQKGETADAAARRKILEEIGIAFTGQLIPMGYYEDHYLENAFNKNTSYDTLSIVFAGDLVGLPNIQLDATSDDFGLFDELPKRFRVKKFYGADV